MNRESERNRLVELIENFFEKEIEASFVKGFLDKFADNILDDGWLRPPVKVEQYIWFFKNDKLTFGQVEDITISQNGLFAFVYEVDAEDEVVGEWTVPLCEYGKTVFTSREDAKKALEGKEGEG
jgi:hypothetical protein